MLPPNLYIIIPRGLSRNVQFNKTKIPLRELPFDCYGEGGRFFEKKLFLIFENISKQHNLKINMIKAERRKWKNCSGKNMFYWHLRELLFDSDWGREVFLFFLMFFLFLSQNIICFWFVQENISKQHLYSKIKAERSKWKNCSGKFIGTFVQFKI